MLKLGLGIRGRLVRLRSHPFRKKVLSRMAGWLRIYPAEIERNQHFSLASRKVFSAAVGNFEEHCRWQLLVSGHKEPETLAWIRQFDGSGVYLDIGANIGNYVVLTGVEHPAMQIFAVEPEPNNFCQLVKNVKLNQIKASCLMFAVSDHEEILPFFVSSDFQAGRSGHQLAEPVDAHGEKIEWRASFNIFSTTVDRLIEQGMMPVPKYIKIDVDGIEGKIIKGMQLTLANPGVREVLCEMNHAEDLNKLQVNFESFGFKLVHKPVKSVIGNYIFKR